MYKQLQYSSRNCNFGLLEMTRQRLREGSIKWETQLSLGSFSQKILKKIQLLSFSDKTKLIKSQIPKKVKIYIDKNFCVWHTDFVFCSFLTNTGGVNV